jgi:serine/threonine protein kinase
MSELTTDELAQRLLSCRLLDNRQINEALSGLGGRNVDVEAFQSRLLQNEMLTNWQLTRVLEGHRRGYFYGNWKVLYLVGAGTFARVYRSVNIKTGAVMAVKVLRNRYTDDMITRERFMREAQTVMKLRHPNIVPIHEVDSHRGRIYMVMDFIEGQNLREFLKAHGQIRPLTALSVTRDVCAGLDYAVSQGITHRDVKLSNVLLSSSGRASLVDFGLAAAEDQQDRGGFYNPRSVDYAGLEKTTNADRNDRRSDIFFAGCNLYQMLSGESPLFETRERMKRMSAERYRQIRPLSSICPDLPHSVIALTNRMMALDPDERFQSAREAMQATTRVVRAIKEGDTRRYDEQRSEEEAQAWAKLTQRHTEGEGKTVMIVESSPALQDMLRKKLKKYSYRVLIFSNPALALDRFRFLDPAEDLPADCLIFGTAGLGHEGLKAFHDFVQFPLGRKIPCLLLVKQDRRQEFLGQLELQDHHRVLSLPVKFHDIRDKLRELLDIQPQDAAVAGDDDAEDIGNGASMQ